MDIWNCTFPISTIEIEISNGCKWLNMALGSHNLTWFGCLRPSSATWVDGDIVVLYFDAKEFV